MNELITWELKYLIYIVKKKIIICHIIGTNYISSRENYVM